MHRFRLYCIVTHNNATEHHTDNKLLARKSKLSDMWGIPELPHFPRSVAVIAAAIEAVVMMQLNVGRYIG